MTARTSDQAHTGEPSFDDAIMIERSFEDGESFAALYDRHAARLHRFVARRLGSQSADDVVAECFLAATGTEPPVGSPDDAVVAAVSAHSVRRPLAEALARLRPADRDVLLLVAWADLSYQEVAEALNIPIGTVRSRLNRARRIVRAALGDTNPLHIAEEA